MCIFPSNKSPIARIQRLLIEQKLIWLWAVRARWESSDSVEVRTMTDKELDWCMSHDVAGMTSYCHAHFEVEKSETVVRLDFDHANAQWFEAMREIRDRESLWCLKHLVSTLVTGDGVQVRVWKAPRDRTFAQVFLNSHRSKS